MVFWVKYFSFRDVDGLNFNKGMVGWRTASIRKESEMPEVRHVCYHQVTLQFSENMYFSYSLFLSANAIRLSCRSRPTAVVVRSH